MTAMRCSTCRWFDRDEWEITPGQKGTTENGLCRVQPPHADHEWPEVSEHDWCGQHEAKENDKDKEHG